MHSEVKVVFDAGQEFRIDLNEVQPLPNEAARAWLDQQFVELDCEPLRATGKVLVADKVLVVAQAAGPKLFSDEAWRAQFARAASTALGKPVMRVDVAAMAITY